MQFLLLLLRDSIKNYVFASITKFLNIFTIKKTLQQLYKIKFYNRFDIIAIFNKIRIYFDNKYKIIFIICYNLFKYVVILFKIYNILVTIQIFFNKTLNFYLNNFYIVYIINILIYSNIEKNYKNYIN